MKEKFNEVVRVIGGASIVTTIISLLIVIWSDEVNYSGRILGTSIVLAFICYLLDDDIKK